MAEQSFGIELRAGADVSEFRRELKAAQGDVEKLGKVIDHFKRQAGDVATGQDVLLTFQGVDAASSTIKVVESSLNKYSGTLKETIQQLNKISGAERKSVTSLSQKLSFLKQSQGRVARNSRQYRILQKAIDKYTTALRTAKGIQKGSIADLNEQAQQLEKLANQYTIGSAEQIKYANAAKKVKDQIKKSTNPLSKFFSVLNRIATVQAGFTAIAAVISTFTGSLNKFITQTKALEGFELALKNIGLSSVEVNNRLSDASRIANELGAPLEQVEKSFKRMVPALEAVGVSAADSSKFLQGVAARTQTLGLNTEQTGRFMEAFAQVLSKGKLQSEELNQQISELDGAFRGQLADSLGVTTRQLEDMIQKSEVTSKVFVTAFNNMANGADELKKRIEEGNATVQQIQNRISNLQIDNLRTIGKAIEPGIKAIFSIQLAIEEMVNTIAKSETGELLASIFNNIALGAQDFFKAITNLVTGVNALIEPLSFILKHFGGLVRVVTTATLAFVTFKTVLAITGLLKGVAAGVGLVTTAMLALDVVLTAITSRVAFAILLELIKSKAIALLAKFAPLLVGFAKFAIVALPAAAALGAFKDNAERAEKRTEEFTSKVQGAIDKIKDIPDAVDEADKALGKFAKPKIPIADSKIFRRASEGPLPGSFQEAVLAFEDPTERLKDVFDQQKKLNEELQRTGVLTKENTIDVGKFSDMATGDLIRLLEGTKEYTEGLSDQKTEMQQLTEGAKKAGITNNDFFMSILKVIDGLDRQNPGLQLLLRLLGEEIDKRKQQNGSIRETAKNMKQLNEQLKIEADVRKQVDYQLETQLMTRFGDSAKDAADKTLQLAAARAELAQSNLATIQEDIKNIQERPITDDFTQEDKGEMLTKLNSQLNEAERAVAESSDRMNQIVQEDLERTLSDITKVADGYQQLAQTMLNGSNQLRQSAQGALGELRSLADIVFNRMKEGQGPNKSAQIEEQRIAFLANVNRLEQQIATGRLTAEYAIQRLQNQQLQARLQAELQLAARRGDESAVADLQGQLRIAQQLAGQQNALFRFESARLRVQGALKDEALAQEAVQRGIGARYVNQDRRLAEIRKKFGLVKVDANDLNNFFQQVDQTTTKDIVKLDRGAINAATAAVIQQQSSFDTLKNRAQEFNDLIKSSTGQGGILATALNTAATNMSNVATEGSNFAGSMGQALNYINAIISKLSGTPAARFTGGPVEAGQTYRVNDAGLGREAFMNKFGDIKMLPASSNMNWTAPSSGTIIPAKLVKAMQKNAEINSKISNKGSQQIPKISVAASNAFSNDSGNLMKQIGSAVSGSTSNRITNNVTIQSQNPVNDASDLMTNVARMRLRNSRRI